MGYFRTIDDHIVYLKGDDPNPSESAKYLKDRNAKIAKSEGAKTTKPAKLSYAEKGAIQDYSENHFQKINAHLRGVEDGGKSVDTIVNGVDSGLDKLPEYAGKVHRSFNVTPEQYKAFQESHHVGAMVSDSAYASTSRRERGLSGLGKNKVNIEYEPGHGGRDISHFSLNPSEQEVLIPRGQKFKVTHQSTGEYGELKLRLARAK